MDYKLVNNEISITKSILEYCGISILILFGTYNSVFSLGALAIMAYIIVFKETDYSVGLIFFSVSMANIFKVSADGVSFFTYIELLFVVVSVFKKNLMFTVLDCSIGAFICYLAFVQVIMSGSISVTLTIKMMSHLLLLSFLIQFIDVNKFIVLISYVYGVIVASFMSLFNGSIFRITQYVSTKEIRISGEMTSRFAGLYADPNYYTVNLIIALCIIVILYEKSIISPIVSILLSISLIGFAGMTGSKSALLMLAFPVLLFLYFSVKSKKYHIVLFAMIGVAFAISLIFSGKFEVFNNAIVRMKSASDAKSLTTGRSEIWKMYFEFFRANPTRVFLGNSINNVTLNGRAAHNTYIDLIYQFGIIGSIWFLEVLRRLYVNNTTNSLKNIANYSVIIVVLIMYFFLSELQYFDMFFHIFIGYLILDLKIDFYELAE